MRVLVVLVVLVGFAFGGIKQARADFWSDLLDGSCAVGEEYRGYHRVASRCPSCTNSAGDPAWQAFRSGGRNCIGCGHCGGTYYRVCEGDSGYPVPSCVSSPETEDEAQDTERLGDILASLGGGGLAGNPFAPGASGSVSPLSLFGDDIGAVEADDLVPQVGDGDDGYECPAGTVLVEEGDDAGLCRVESRCVFYGAASGTWPDCVCANSDADRHPLLSGSGWFWDEFALRCVPRETANPGSLRAPLNNTGNNSALWNTICETDYTNWRTQGTVAVQDYLTRSSPVFGVRRGGIEVLRYGSVSSLTINLGAADWALSADEEGDETTFGRVICSWLQGPMKNVEQAFAGFAISRAATRCPALTIPFFNQVVVLDVHCYLVGRWLGLIQAIAVIAYSFMGANYVWGRNTGHIRSFAGQSW